GDETLRARPLGARAGARAMEGRFNDALAALQPYAQPESRRRLLKPLADKTHAAQFNEVLRNAPRRTPRAQRNGHASCG
ncbi:MAG TPA: hypothetical protein VIP46_15175, partial [Pyrinomonadaceae bacterium]